MTSWWVTMMIGVAASGLSCAAVDGPPPGSASGFFIPEGLNGALLSEAEGSFPDSIVPPSAEAAYTLGQAESAPLGPIWRGVAADRDLRTEDARSAWTEALVRPSEEALVAAELLSARMRPRAVDAPSREAFASLFPDGLDARVRARLTWSATGPERDPGWLPGFQVSDGRFTWPAESSPHLAHISGGGATGKLSVARCFRAPRRAYLLLWTRLMGTIWIDDKVIWHRDRPGLPYVELSIRSEAPGPASLRAELWADGSDDRLGVFVGGDGPVTACSKRPPTRPAKRTVVRIPPADPEFGPWPRRLLWALRSSGGFGTSRAVEDASLGWVPIRAPHAGPLVDAWAGWARNRVSVPAVLGVVRDLPESQWSPRTWLTRGTLEEQTDPRLAIRTLQEGLRRHERPELRVALFRALEAEGRWPEAGETVATGTLPRSHPATLEAKMLLRRLGRFDRAADWQPSDPQLRLEWRAQQDPRAVFEDIRDQTPPGLMWSRRFARWSLLFDGPRAGAVAAFNLAQRAPHDVPSFRLLWDASLASNDPTRALWARAGLRRLGATDFGTELWLVPAQDPWADVPGLSERLDYDPTSRIGPRSRFDWGTGFDRVILLKRRVERLFVEGGSMAEHRLMERVQTQSGIEAVGQIAPPNDAVVLALRTWKGDGRIFRADHHAGMTDRSFVDIQPHDAVESAWLTLETHSGPLVRTFGFESDVPTERSEYVVVAPTDLNVHYRSVNGAPHPTITTANGHHIWTWSMEDVPARRLEPHAVPPAEVSPSVTIWTGNAREDALRANAVRPLPQSPWVRSFGKAHTRELESHLEKAEALYRYVAENIEPGPDSDPVNTLLSRRGNRTILLYELLTGAEVPAVIVLARTGLEGRRPASIPDADRFSLELIRLGHSNSHRWIGFDGPSSWFGRLPAAFRSGSYVETVERLPSDQRPVVHLIEDEDIDVRPLVTRLDLRLEEDLVARGTIALDLPPPWHGRVLDNLVGRSDRELVQIFEQALTEIIGPTHVHDVKLPELVVEVELPDLIEARKTGIHTEELTIRSLSSVPPMTVLLGLPGPSEYLVPAVRQSPLLLAERREAFTLRLELQAEAVRDQPPRFRRSSSFGGFSQAFSFRDGEVILQREWSFAQLRIQPEDQLPFRNVMERVLSDTRVPLRFVRRIAAETTNP
ncbi:MAG: DUF3857 domain-containing protein [Myxococcota bacterium]